MLMVGLGHSVASYADGSSHGILIVATVADHDWPSRLLPRGFSIDVCLYLVGQKTQQHVTGTCVLSSFPWA